MQDPIQPADDSVREVRRSGPSALLHSDDWWAVWIGAALLALSALLVWGTMPADFDPAAGKKLANPAREWLGQPGKWSTNPLDAFRSGGDFIWKKLLGVFALGLIVFGFARRVMGHSLAGFAAGYSGVFLLALAAFVITGQTFADRYNLESALWALLLGLVISNGPGTPRFLHPAIRTEFYIKTGLVLLGGEVLIGRLLALGVPGLFVSWVVTPIVLIGTFLFGQHVLRIRSKSLNMVISADMSVCGVSAAIATAAACRAKKEELSLAIGLSLTFTVIMMVAMPAFIRAVGISDVVGGAWMGGTIDSTGAVAAAGGMLGETALMVATTIKMLQNLLIGLLAFGVAVYWVARVEPAAAGGRPNALEIWRRLPKFVLGFVGVSIAFSLIHSRGPEGAAIVDGAVGGTKVLRNWFFCLAFVSIGLETNFRELAAHFQGGKPLWLYLIGQTFNLLLTLFMSWLMFEVVFADNVAAIVESGGK